MVITLEFKAKNRYKDTTVSKKDDFLLVFEMTDPSTGSKITDWLVNIKPGRGWKETDKGVLGAIKKNTEIKVPIKITPKKGAVNKQYKAELNVWLAEGGNPIYQFKELDQPITFDLTPSKEESKKSSKEIEKMISDLTKMHRKVDINYLDKFLSQKDELKLADFEKLKKAIEALYSQKVNTGNEADVQPFSKNWLTKLGGVEEHMRELSRIQDAIRRQLINLYDPERPQMDWHNEKLIFDDDGKIQRKTWAKMRKSKKGKQINDEIINVLKQEFVKQLTDALKSAEELVGKLKAI